jgi:excinuclease UvrABC nuclease subunit
LLPEVIAVRYSAMSETIETLQQKMAAAALALDFDEAKRCRVMIGAMRGGATAADAEQANFAGWSGSSQQPWAWGAASSG